MTRRLLIAALALAALAACKSDKAAPPSDPKADPKVDSEVDPDIDPVAACEAFHAQLVTCQEPIIQAVGARMPGADLTGLRKKLTAAPSCAGARMDRVSKTAACLSEDCAAMAACMADVLAPIPPDAGVPTSTSEGHNLLFVLVDTVRADRLGVAGYQRDGASMTPRIDEFAKGAVRFSRAYAQGPNTPRSLPSIWASRYPSQIPFIPKVFHNFPGVSDDATMLFETLAGAGMFTTGFSSHFYFEKQRNVAQGFAEYDNRGSLSIKESNKDFASPRVVPRAIARLEQLAAAKTRFAMFVHLFEPHSTYIEHPDFPVKLKSVAGLAEKYDYEIAVADRYVGELLDAVGKLALDDKTIVVILSDHGEAFGVHRDQEGDKLYFHGQALYDEVLRAMLLIRVPGVAASVHDDLVALLDVAPTLLDVLGIPVPPTFDGRSLAPLWRGETLPPRPVGAILQATPGWKYSAQALISADGKDKIIVHGDGKVEVYDLAADPEERKDLSADKPRTERLRAALDAWAASVAN